VTAEEVSRSLALTTEDQSLSLAAIEDSWMYKIKGGCDMVIVKCISVQTKYNKDSLYPDKVSLLVTWHTKHITVYSTNGGEEENLYDIGGNVRRK
jgi:hypothetical protein